MNSTRIGALLIVLGVIAIVLSALADPIGLGGNETAFGWKQTVGVVVGALVLVAGVLVSYRARQAGSAESDESTA